MKLKHLFTLLVCGTLLFACENGGGEDGGSEDDVNPQVAPEDEYKFLDVFDDADAIKPLFISLFKVYSDTGVKNYDLYSGLKHDKYWIGIVEQTAKDQYEKYFEWTDKNAIEKVKYVDVGYGETEKYTGLVTKHS